MSIDLHRMQVEITAEINKFKQKCDAVKAEAKKTSDAANKALSRIGDEKFAYKATRQFEEIQRQTQATCNKIKQLSKQAQIDAGLLVPSEGYKKAESQIASVQRQIEKLKQKQSLLSDKDARVMTTGYSMCADQVKELEQRIDAMIAKQQSWLDIGVDPRTSSAFQELDEEIEKTNAELREYQERMAQMESKGEAFAPSDKWKNLQRQIAAAREQIQGYRADQAQMASSGEDYVPAKDAGGSGKLAKAYAVAGKRALTGMATEAAKVHPALQRVITLAQKFGNTAKTAGNMAKVAMKGVAAPVKAASSFLRLLSTGFGKVYQKIRGGISVLDRFRSSSDRLSSSCGKLLGRMGALRITATYMLASFMIMGGINAMKEGFKNLSQYSSQTNRDLSMLMSSLTQLKNSLATAFAPILTVVAPILNTLINWLSAAMTAIAHFMAAITGKNQVVVARKVNQDFAGSIADTGSAADGAADSVEKYKRSLMGFDQINKLDDPDTGSGGSGGGAGGGAGGVSPSDMFETVEVGSTFLDWADKFKEAWESADFTEIGQIVGEKLNAALESIPWDKIKETSAKIAKSIATFLNGFIEAVDWNLVGGTLAEGINTVIEFAYAFVTNFNWQNFGTAIGQAINGFFEKLDLAKAGKALSEGIKGILESINTALEEVNWGQIGQKVGDFLTNIDWLGVLVGAGKAIANALIALMDFAEGLFKSICDGLKNMSWGDIAKAAWELFKAAWKVIDTAVEVAVSLMRNAWSTIADFVGDAVNVAISLAKSGWDTLTGFVGDKIEAGVTLVKDGWDNFTDFIGNTAKSIELKVTATTDKLFDSIVGVWNNIKDSSVVKKLSTQKEKWADITSTFISLAGGNLKKTLSTGKGSWSKITSTWASYKSKTLKKTLATAKGKWNKITTAWANLKGGSFTKKLLTTVKLPKISWTTKTFKKGPIKINYPWPSLSWQKYAKGGFPEEGPFMMNRGEIAGKFSNGKGVVANNQQITTGITNAVEPAVYRAVLSAMKERSDDKGNVTIVLQGDAKGLFKAVRQEAKNYTNATGQAAFPV